MRNKLTIKSNECEHVKQINLENNRKIKELMQDNEDLVEQIQKLKKDLSNEKLNILKFKDIQSDGKSPFYF